MLQLFKEYKYMAFYSLSGIV